MLSFSRARRAAILAGGGAATTAWYLAGGAPAPIAAYQAKGAASLAASYVNLANPGTYDLTLGGAPTFDTSTGWTFNGSSQYLKTGITPNANYSILVRFTDAIDAVQGAMGQIDASLTCTLGALPKNSTSAFYFYGNKSYVGAGIAAGVMIITPTKAFLDGVAVTTWSSPTWTGTPLEILIGGVNYTSRFYFNGKIQAALVYGSDIAAQAAALSAAAISF